MGKIGNLDEIFGLFSHDDNDISNGKTSYQDLKSSPIYYVGMYKKLILNHINFNKKVSRSIDNPFLALLAIVSSLWAIAS